LFHFTTPYRRTGSCSWTGLACTHAFVQLTLSESVCNDNLPPQTLLADRQIHPAVYCRTSSAPGPRSRSPPLPMLPRVPSLTPCSWLRRPTVNPFIRAPTRRLAFAGLSKRSSPVVALPYLGSLSPPIQRQKADTSEHETATALRSLRGRRRCQTSMLLFTISKPGRRI
jgi:hypothetical protein